MAGLACYSQRTIPHRREIRTALGYRLFHWEWGVPPIPKVVLDSVVFLFDSPSDAREGTPGSGGTGFLLAYPGRFYPHAYIVTAKHVVSGGATAVRINTRSGGVDVFEPSWKINDCEDLAIASFIPADEHKAGGIPLDALLTKQVVEEHAVSPGDDVWMLGRYRGFEGQGRNVPVARFGALAGVDLAAIRNDYGVRQESFLVEMRSISGYSGSPVFLGFPDTWRPYPKESKALQDEVTKAKARERPGGLKRIVVPPQFGPWLLGVDWGHLEERPGESAMTSGMAAVVPAWKLAEFLEEDEFKMQRKKDEESQRNEPRAVSDSAKGNSEENLKGPTREEFFETLRRVSRPREDEEAED